MEYIITIVISIIILIILAFVLELNIKKLKRIGNNKGLDELTNSFPENIDICKNILQMLGNTKVTIKEEKDSKTNLYMVVSDSIIIANIRNSYTRIQTIAHECIHSIQSKKMLWFNFIYTNIYMLYFILIALLTIFKIVDCKQIFLYILIIMGMVQYFIRSMLETEAMIKARYVAKEYLEQNNICSKEEIKSIIEQYDKINSFGVKLVNYDILAKNFSKIVIFSLICILL